jgi:hypothetical protein
MIFNKNIHILIVGKSQWIDYKLLNDRIQIRNKDKISFIINTVSYRDFISNPQYNCIYDYVIWVGFDMKCFSRKFSDYIKISIELPIFIIDNFMNDCKNTKFIIIGSNARFCPYTRYGFAKQAIISHISFERNNLFIIDPSTITVDNYVVLFGLKSRFLFKFFCKFKIIALNSNFLIIDNIIDIIFFDFKSNVNINYGNILVEPLNFRSPTRIKFYLLKLPRPVVIDRILSIIFLLANKLIKK